MSRKKRALEVDVTQLPVEAAVESVVVSEPAAPSATVRWRVLETQRVSWYGHLTVLNAGVEISVNEYGPEGIARLIEQGLKLEPMV